MVRVIVDSHEHGRIKAMSEMLLNAEVSPLECGDFRVEGQGFDVVVATICPLKEIKEKVKEITGCRFVLCEGGDERGFTYEI